MFHRMQQRFPKAPTLNLPNLPKLCVDTTAFYVIIENSANPLEYVAALGGSWPTDFETPWPNIRKKRKPISYTNANQQHPQVTTHNTNKPRFPELTKRGRSFYRSLQFLTSSILWNPKVHCHVHRNPRPVPILSQMNPLLTLPSYLPKTCFNIILSSAPRIFSFRHSY
jgi:hypothetical protein